MAEVKLSLEETTKKYLDRRGGVVIEHLVAVLKRIHDKDAPELESEAKFKEFLSSKPDVFRIAVSVNDVERARLTSPRRASKGLIGLTISVLTDQAAFSEETACPVSEVFAKVVAAKKEQIAEGEGEEEGLPEDLESEAEFMLSAQRFNRIRFSDNKVWIVPRPERRPREAGASATTTNPSTTRTARKGREPKEKTDDTTKADGEKPGKRRSQGTPKDPKELALPEDANDSTFIASLIYKRLCSRGAISMQFGLPVKVLLRLSSIDFKEARPDAEPASMNSLRVFKMLLSQIAGIKRQWPRLPPRPTGRPARFTPELIVWMEEEDEMVACIKEGLPDDLATMSSKPEVMEENEQIANGEPQTVSVLAQDAWNTSVVGPTSSEEVLAKFLDDYKDQAVWGFETEHRVGLHRRPAGKIAVIVLSDMHHTIIWDVHQGGIPDCLRAFFANEEVFKGGVRIAPKVQKLRRQFDVTTAKFVELSTIAKGLDLITEEEKERISIRIMTNNILHFAVSRPPGVRDSNWELRPLTKRQYNYAVEDGYATALLFMHMVAQLHKINQGTKLNEAVVQ